ncbi:SpoIIE family protein phosphatase [Actinoplanes sp. TRM 88003]|uniref:SpoIIE family protein phosphatase n=1 Tax=Paractinoplanes aksuensis TaxID=2939490 RepID=A0ABT1DL60_9ACTN|nr:SpoIIE family protein phosphatase [Actinoplanes aksuensis]MCO8271577.1 SpoIIE family protein phosphatase [Actinoplanes aksuensis]
MRPRLGWPLGRRSHRRRGAPQPPAPATDLFPALLEDDLADLYDEAPCGFVSTLPDGTIAKINTTLLVWTGLARADLIGRRRFADLLAPGSRILFETRYAPLLRLQGEAKGVALELRTGDDTSLPVLITSTVKPGHNGAPLLIRTTVFDARERRAYENQLLQARQAADQERDRLRLLVAGLQRSLLPVTLAVPPGMTTASHYHMASADEVGGDFYDLFPLSGDRWGFFLGDVRGKGVVAAAVTAAARYTLRAAAVYDSEPIAVLRNLNTVLYQDYAAPGHRHCTVIFGILERSDGGYTATVASGGHPPALVARADGSVAYQPTDGGTLVGILAEPRLVARTIPLGPGDTLILYSDGLTEARTGTGARYGDETLREFVAEQAPTSAPTVVEALAGLLTTFAEVDDDVAMIALTVNAAGRDR